MFVFSTYLIVFLLKFRSGELVGCGIRFCIQRVPTLHTFDGPRYPKNKKYLKKRDDDVLINFGGRKKKKLLFVFVFLTYILVFLLKFRSRDLVGCRIWFRIQRVPTLHTFDRPCYPKNKKYLKKMWWWHHHHVFFRYFLFFGYWGLSKVCSVGTRWMRN